MRKLTTAALVALVGVVAPAIPAEAATSVYLVSTRDFTVSCLAMPWRKSIPICNPCSTTWE